MVSINTCLMVDLKGQVASESIEPAQYSRTGGQSDTAQGAVAAPEFREELTHQAKALGYI
ncbi:MAG TPA: acetyl-CoA hydrolase/transferase C-terminal domain-containing protein [Spirochaetales bacterium]|nr:acetyl-CoA hydrolase/transferase C-terminal domain-containing protein [Spirochaetales bacterium]HOT60050.1 acetyl-CoA hydrolase/transferase C-terminal domain-containing protein [Spirochaetales bacterium]HPD80742.1 acetyl-CoA hydrolase/transferase C-terminal domain-containing protein [Spirochaetales bacterium]HQK34941.1 acetyl-CoA hydrolase/transferase C-terminal domain-containing protein [Spirochaetales bacterium]